MKQSKLSQVFLFTAAITLLAVPAFAEKIGVIFEGNETLQKSVSEAMKTDGHEIIDISAAATGVKLDAVAAAEIGKKTGAQIIVSGKKVGPFLILKLLSTKNDVVAGGASTSEESDAVVEQVKTILKKNKDKMLQ